MGGAAPYLRLARPGDPAGARPGQAVHDPASSQLGRAEQFLLRGLERETRPPGPLRPDCLLGRAADHLAGLFRILRPNQAALGPAASLQLSQAELFLLSLDREVQPPNSVRAAYLLGLAESHLAGLCQMLRALTR